MPVGISTARPACLADDKARFPCPRRAILAQSRYSDVMSDTPAPPNRWTVAGRDTDFGPTPRIFGILNVTPDSFSDGGQHDAVDTAVAHAKRLLAEGADVIDVGGESTRPGATPVEEAEELRRTVNVVRAVAATGAVVSIDTTKAAVAEACLNAGATVLNDISGLTFDPRMPEVAAASDCGVVCMHIRGTPQTMQNEPRYDDVVSEVRDWLLCRVEALGRVGVAAERIALDPGVGFGKTAEHNVHLLRSIADLRAAGHAVLVGHSRKRFVGRIVGREVDERLAGTVGVSLAMAAAGVEMLRVHDVAANRDAITAFAAVRGTAL